MEDRVADDPNATILIVEDDVSLAALIAETLRRDGHEVRVKHDAVGLNAVVERDKPSLVLLDWMLPHVDGLTALRALRPEYDGTIVMLTARDGDTDQIRGLEHGADDYIVKPVTPQVLRARVRASLRRAERTATQKPVMAMHFGDLTVYPQAREAHGPEGVIPTTSAEYDLLLLLAKRAGEVVSRDTLFRELRGIEYDGLDRSMDLRVSKLRAKLKKHLGTSNPIRTVHGSGYMLAQRPGG